MIQFRGAVLRAPTLPIRAGNFVRFSKGLRYDMKQTIKSIIVLKHNNKLFLKMERKTQLGCFLEISLTENSTPEQSINTFFQKEFDVIPDDISIIDVFYSKASLEDFYIIYDIKIKDTLDFIDKTSRYHHYGWRNWTGQDMMLSQLSQDVLEFLIKKNYFRSSEDTRQDIISHGKHLLYTDGASRGNPGHSGIGYVLYDYNNKMLLSQGEYIGITVSAIAEYKAVLRGVEQAFEQGVGELEIRVDNLMIVKQMTGEYDIKNRELWPLHQRIIELCDRFNKVKFVHVRREFNEAADGLANQAIDKYLTKTVK